MRESGKIAGMAGVVCAPGVRRKNNKGDTEMRQEMRRSEEERRDRDKVGRG